MLQQNATSTTAAYPTGYSMFAINDDNFSCEFLDTTCLCVISQEVQWTIVPKPQWLQTWTGNKGQINTNWSNPQVYN